MDTPRSIRSVAQLLGLAFIATTPSAAAPTYRHGDLITLTGSFGTHSVTKTFLGGAGGLIEYQPVGATMPNSNNWTFHTLGYTAAIKVDPARGKVLFNPEDSSHYAATRRYDSGAPIPEQRYLYKAHYVRNVMLLDGLPYTKSYQWKHERINWENSIEDGDCEIKVHNWPPNGPISFVNRSASDKSTYWGSAAQAPSSNGDWALMEIFVFTGTQGQSDGKVITRVHKNGRTVVGLNRQAERVYADPALRFRYFLEQNYFGNLGQSEDGVDNPLPKPQVRELYSDDSQVIVGLDAFSGFRRIELRDTVELNTATIRELQDWTTWNGNIDLHLNTGGIPPGEHDLYLVVVDGVDSDGLDIVSYSQPIHVQVDPIVVTPDAHAPTIPTSLIGTTGSATTISLSWTASTDNVDISGYRIYRDSSLIGSTSARSYPDTRIVLGQTYRYTVSAFDPAGNESALSAATTVTAHDAASSYAAWRAAGFSWRDQPLDAISGPLADPDAVGLSNYTRYAFYLATRGRVAAPATLGTVHSGGQDYLTLTFTRRSVATGLSYILEGSTDLVTWTPVPGQTYSPGTPAAVTAQDSVAIGATGPMRRFLRVRVAAP